MDFDQLDLLLGVRDEADVMCPQCSDQRKVMNRKKKVLRLWRIEPGFITYHCAHCEASGHASSRDHDGRQIDREAFQRAEAARNERRLSAQEESREKARAIYARGKPIKGTLAETYWHDIRKISAPLPATMRFLPATDRWPDPAVMLPFGYCQEPQPGVLSIARGAIVGLHLTRLAPDGNKIADKAKIMIGQGSQGYPLEMAAGENGTLVIAEGPEHVMAIHQVTGWSAWAAGSKNRFEPLADRIPRLYTEIVISVDDDDDAGSEASAKKLLYRLKNRDAKIIKVK